MNRREFLMRTAGVGIAGPLMGCATVGADPIETSAGPDGKKALGSTSVYVPGYLTASARARGGPALANPQMARAIANQDGPARLLTKIGLDGSLRQALLPVMAQHLQAGFGPFQQFNCGTLRTNITTDLHFARLGELLHGT